MKRRGVLRGLLVTPAIIAAKAALPMIPGDVRPLKVTTRLVHHCTIWSHDIMHGGDIVGPQSGVRLLG